MYLLVVDDTLVAEATLSARTCRVLLCRHRRDTKRAELDQALGKFYDI